MPQSTAVLLIEQLKSVLVDVEALRMHIAAEQWQMIDWFADPPARPSVIMSRAICQHTVHV